MNTKIFIILILAIATVYACGEPAHVTKRRASIEKRMGFRNITQKHMDRRTQSAGAWRPLRIFFDMTSINSSLRSNGASNRIAYYKKVFDNTGAWWSSVLKVNDDRSRIAPQIARYARNYQRELGFEMGSESISNYDLLIRVFLCANNGPALAYAGPFVRHPTSQRPITGTVCILPYGDANFKRAADSVNRGIGTVIHEFGHVISFIQFEKYQRANLELDTNMNKYKFKGPKVLTAARKYYGCNSLDGVPLQNNNGRIGGHWSETYLANELMTPTTGADAESVSPMTLALCEDTRWYKADYGFSENYTHGKGKGCSFFNSACPSPAVCVNGTTGFVTSDFKGFGRCILNSSNCPTESKYSNRDCMNGAGWESSFASFGASYGENCAVVQGSFKRSEGGWTYSQSMVSVQARCTSSNSSYSLTFKGFNSGSDATVNCTRSGDVSFTAGGKSQIVKCKTPSAFCRARFGASANHCDNTCGKNGRCRNTQATGRRLIANLRRAQAVAVCADGSTPTVPTTQTQATAAVVTTPSRTSASRMTWGCWCYSDQRTRTACPDLQEDLDGEGY